MIKRFEEFFKSFSLLQKCVRQLKDKNMKAFSLKGSHVMSLFYLMQHPQGLTLTELNDLCVEDKAATSRTVSYLKKHGYIVHNLNKNEKTYNSRLTLTKKGEETAETVKNLINPIMEVATENLSLEEQDLILDLLKRLSDNLNNYIRNEKNPQVF